jgi:hypothetical protein
VRAARLLDPHNKKEAQMAKQKPFVRFERAAPKPTHQWINRAARRKAAHNKTPLANGEFWTLMKPFVKPRTQR